MSPPLPDIPSRVYPRVGGGNNIPDGVDNAVTGLSPRGRGKPPVAQRIAVGARSIPAWAGETPRACIRSRQGRVYPRVGGGND